MTKREYQELVERNFGKPLKEIMHELCVVRDLVPLEGAHILGVPKDIFIYWRTEFRFGPNQLRYDCAERIIERNLKLYQEQLNGIDVKRPFFYYEEKSLEGFKEIVERYLELTKMKRLSHDSNNDEMQNDIRIACLEYTLNLLNSYDEGELYDRYFSEI